MPNDRVSASCKTDLQIFISDAKSGNPITFILHSVLNNLFLTLYKSDLLVCSECSQFRNFQSDIVGECLSAPFHRSSSFWWDGKSGYLCIQPVPEELEAALATA